MATVAIGFVACVVATLFFGIMWVPLKKFDCGDGFYVQWVMCVAIFVVGVCVNAIQTFPKFYPLAMLGGVLWATGNVTAIPILNTIGMGLGVLLWSSSNLLSGWASGRFGWFGLKEQTDNNQALNYTAVILAFISTILFAFVKPRDPSVIEGRGNSEDQEPILNGDNEDPSVDSGVIGGDSDVQLVRPPRGRESRWSMISGNHKRTVMIFVSLTAGIFYGLCFAPVIWIQDNVEGASKEGLDYVFAHYCGILVASTVYFVVYCAFKQNKPVVNAATTLPAFVAGIMWGIAQAAFFVANEALSEAVSFPIVTRFPGLISAALGVFMYKEIRGRRNLQILAVSILLTIVGGVLAGLSSVYK